MSNLQAYIGRLPILDHQQKIVGYKLLPWHRDLATNPILLPNALTLCAEHWGNKGLMFVELPEELLTPAVLDTLSPGHTVIEVSLGATPGPELLEKCKNLRARHFALALRDFPLNQQSIPFFQIAQYLKLNLLSMEREPFAAQVRQLGKLPLKLIAEKVETHSGQQFCKQLGIPLWQGSFFAFPENLVAHEVSPAHANVVDALNKVRLNADISEIEKCFKRDAALSFKLLRYINSAGFGLSCEIQSLRHALNILGYSQLFRWLTLLLVTAGDSATSPALMKTAIVRGRLTELLGQDLLDKQERDNLFIVGVFSLLEAMMEIPIDKILSQINLPETVCDALLSRSGIFGPFLELAEACEAVDMSYLEQLAESLQLSPERINLAHLDALAWVEELGI